MEAVLKKRGTGKAFSLLVVPRLRRLPKETLQYFGRLALLLPPALLRGRAGHGGRSGFVFAARLAHEGSAMFFEQTFHRFIVAAQGKGHWLDKLLGWQLEFLLLLELKIEHLLEMFFEIIVTVHFHLGLGVGAPISRVKRWRRSKTSGDHFQASNNTL
jgi:hypothetical protein